MSKKKIPTLTKSKNSQFKLLSLWLVIAVVSVFAIGSIVVAYTGYTNRVIENVEVYNEAGQGVVNSDLEDAVFSATGSRFPNGISTDSTSPNAGQIRGTLLTVTASSTIDQLYHTVQIDLDFAQATSSAVGSTTLILGSERYTGPDLVCSLSGDGAFMGWDGLIPYTATYRLTTTTCQTAQSTTCGDGVTSFTATTSQGLITGTELATSTALLSPYNADDEEGDVTREAFYLTDDTWFIATLDFSTSLFPTTTMPTTSAKGLTATHETAGLKCRLR